MQSMTDLAELTLNLLQAFYIFCSLSNKHSQLIQQIKIMNLQEFTTARIIYLVNRAEKFKFVVAALTEVKQKSDSLNFNQSSKKQCISVTELMIESSSDFTAASSLTFA